MYWYVKIFGVLLKYFLSLKNIYKIYQKYSNTETQINLCLDMNTEPLCKHRATL